jgi:hypothetical protein
MLAALPQLELTQEWQPWNIEPGWISPEDLLADAHLDLSDVNFRSDRCAVFDLSWYCACRRIGNSNGVVSPSNIRAVKTASVTSHPHAGLMQAQILGLDW